MKRFFKFLIKKINIIILYVLVSLLSIGLVTNYLEVKKQIVQLDLNTEALSEWYRELKDSNLDLENRILKLVKTEDIQKNINEMFKYQKNNKMLTELNKQELKMSLKHPSYNYLKSVTVYIQGISLNKQWMGTGVIVKIDKNYTYILTNAHVAGRDQENVTLFIEDIYKTKLAMIVKLHDKLDLALIKINGKLQRKQAIKGISINIKPQDKVYLVGHHLGRKYIYGDGVFAGYHGIHNIIQIPVLFGNSGSGIFDKNGKLVSLIWGINRIGMFDTDCAHGLGVDIFNIKHFLKKLKIL